MAKDGRTEKATPQKRKESREKGQVIKSKDLNTLMVYGAFFIGVFFFQPYVAKIFYEMFTSGLELLKSGTEPKDIVINLLSIAVVPIGVLYGLILLFIFANHMLQVGFLVAPKAVMPDVKRINPANYWKNIANVKKTGFELVKNLMMFFIISFLIFTVFKGNIPKIQGVLMLGWSDSIDLFSHMFKEFTLKIGIVFLILGVIDYLFQKHQYEENLKMKKEEVKDERKNQEGSPEVKRQQSMVRSKLMERQVKKEVQDAQMIIVNPTHYSVAVRYKKGKGDSVPRVVVKGVDELALAIRKIAKENGIPIIENKPVARKIYDTIEEGDYITEELFEVVGKILSKLVKEEKVKLDL